MKNVNLCVIKIKMMLEIAVVSNLKVGFPLFMRTLCQQKKSNVEAIIEEQFLYFKFASHDKV